MDLSSSRSSDDVLALVTHHLESRSPRTTLAPCVNAAVSFTGEKQAPMEV